MSLTRISLLSAAFFLFAPGAFAEEADARKTGDGKAGTGREVTGRIVRDAPLELCIDGKSVNAIKCLRKFGYLGEGSERGAEENSRKESKKPLLNAPGAKIQRPQFGIQNGAAFGGGGTVGSQGAASSSIGLKGPTNVYREGQGPHAGAKDKLPPPNPK